MQGILYNKNEWAIILCYNINESHKNNDKEVSHKRLLTFRHFAEKFAYPWTKTMLILVI